MFSHGIFPRKWKVARLVLLRKGTKPLDLPASYRPISLLNTIDRLFERVIKSRLEEHLIGEYDLNEHQFGFRKGKSTTDAISTMMNVAKIAMAGQYRRREMCAVVAIDVANAFNSATLDKIMEALRKKKRTRVLSENYKGLPQQPVAGVRRREVPLNIVRGTTRVGGRATLVEYHV